MVFAENRFETLTVYGKVLYELLEITPDTEVAENMFLRLPKLEQVAFVFTKYSYHLLTTHGFVFTSYYLLMALY